MAYRKFDDKSLNVDDSRLKLKNFTKEAWFRALQAVSNRVIGDQNLTACTSAVLATAATGVATTVAVVATINGLQVAIAAAGNLNLGTGAYAGENLGVGRGTMGTNCVTRFLVFAGTSGAAEVAGPGNIVQKKDYATAALAAAACRLPDLPDNCVALGSLLLQGPAAAGVTFNVGGAGTMGTCSFSNFFNMPYTEPFA